MSARPWMPLYIGRLPLPTQPHLTAAQHGAYLLLIMTTGRRVPLPRKIDAAACASIACMPFRMASSTSPCLRTFFGEALEYIIELTRR